MQSLRELFKPGCGPSSSHTMGPQRAAKLFREQNPDAVRFEVTLYGSLSLTGKGHLTDWIILETLKPIETEIFWHDEELPYHPNGMKLSGFDVDGNILSKWTVYSVGGGTIEIEGSGTNANVEDLYKHSNFDHIVKYCNEKGIDLVDYVVENEGEDILEFLETIVDAFITNTERGLSVDGVIPGDLKLIRVAKKLNELAQEATDADEKKRLLISSYAYANSEENASGGMIVTAPTCGAAGVLPAVMYYYYKDLGYEKSKMAKALAVAGIFGNVIKKNATISGAEGGCQAEVGTACVMGAAAVAYLEKLNLPQIEYAAEIGMEHHLGLTCDPVQGYVQIPCIERNAVAAMRSIDAVVLSKALGKLRANSVSFDSIVATMKETGQDLKPEYRETALGGLAIHYYQNNKLKK